MVYLSVIVALAALFAYIFWREMKPTMLRSAPLESAFHQTVSDSPLTLQGHSEEAEQLAVKAAERENQDLESRELEASRRVVKRDTAQPMRAPAAIKHNSKPRRVARTHKRDTRPTYDPWRSWATAWGRDQWSRDRAWSYERSERRRNDRGWNW
jgi:hypothetical protein